MTPTFSKFAFPLVRQVYPQLLVSSIVSIQPMSGPVSSIFYQDYKYAFDTPDDVYRILLHIAMEINKHIKINYRIKRTNNKLYIHHAHNSLQIEIKENEINIIKQAKNNLYMTKTQIEYLDDPESLSKTIKKIKQILANNN